ncbi:MAG TPA: radical SAM/SPASM domain-containing protein [Terriglobia bacterium]|nr:radical SAM/SPASM domain-containing protein [Terriglobia bacterium]
MPVGTVERFLKKVPQYTRNMRHLRSVLQHGTPRKWSNLALAEAERKLRRVRVKSMPYLMIIDPCNYCNLRCPLCPTGLGTLGRPQAFLSLEHFRLYFDPFAPYLFEVYMHNWGESLLNRDVFRMIEHAQSRDVGTNLSSNLSATTRSDIDNLLECGLEYLVVSLDGASAQSYSKYRVRGVFENVVENMSEILRLRKLRRRKTPVVEWQFIVMKQNEHEIPEAERMARQIGVDLLRFIPVGMPYDTPDRKAVAEEWYPVTVRGREHAPDSVEQQFGQANKPSPCFYLYRSIVINPDGGVAPCCVVYKKESDFAQLPARDLRALWNNDHYQSGRALFSPQNAAHPVGTICDGCDIFRKYPKPAPRTNIPSAAGCHPANHGGHPPSELTPPEELVQIDGRRA